jgi:hypothetical protein
VPHHVIIVNASEVHTVPNAKPNVPDAKPASAQAKPAPAVHKPAAPLTPEQALMAEAAAYGVPTAHRIWNGRTVERTRWAILWDIKSRKAAGVKPKQPAYAPAAAKPAAHPVTAKPAAKPQAPKAAAHTAVRLAPAKAKPAKAVAKPHAPGKPVWKAPAKPAWRRPARPAAKRLVKPHHRSIWAIRWQRAHPHKR